MVVRVVRFLHVVVLVDLAQDFLVHAHRLAVPVLRRVEFSQQLGHGERVVVEPAAAATQVVADGVAELDGSGDVPISVARVHEAAADAEDGGTGPGLLDLAGLPELLEEELCHVSLVMEE